MVFKSDTLAYPSEGLVLTPILFTKQMSSGANQRAAREVQNESAKLLTHQDKRLEKLSDMVSALSKRIDQQYAETKEREKVDDKRNEENTCFTRIAAWSAVAGIIVAILSTVIGTWIQIALK